MDVRNCPVCGSEDVAMSSFSAEYMSSTRWECSDCDWFYKRGRGIGTGSGNAGTHPRRAGPASGQSSLTPVGTYCSNCETVIAGEHACTSDVALDQIDEDMPTQEAVQEIMDEFLFRPSEQLAEDVHDGVVALTPTFYRVVEPSEDVMDEHVALVEQEVADMIDDGLDGDAGEMYEREGFVDRSALYRRMNAETGAEKQMIDRAVRRSSLEENRYNEVSTKEKVEAMEVI